MDENLCACIWNNELAMRRLINLLRQTQSVCGDTECYDDLPALPSTEGSAGNDGLMLFGLMWVAIGLFLYIFRPSVVKNTFKNPFNNGGGNNNGGPASGGMAPGVH